MQTPTDHGDSADRPTAVAHIVDLVLERPARCGATRVVAVDGPAGSGKTTLAAAVAVEVVRRGRSVVLHHLDDQYAGWAGLDEALALRVREQVLAPLARGEPARWQRYDWEAGRFDRWESFVPPEVLVLEGCGSGARTLAAYLSVLVWVEAAPDERIRRGVARDGEAVLPNWRAWMESEQAHFAANRTRDRADLIVRSG